MVHPACICHHFFVLWRANRKIEVPDEVYQTFTWLNCTVDSRNQVCKYLESVRMEEL